MKPLNPRQDRFCHAFVHYGNAGLAAREAGYRPSNCYTQGYRLLKCARVRKRVADIQARLAADAGRDAATLIGKLEIVYRRALDHGHYYAAVRAVNLQARLAGLADEPRRPAVAESAAEADSLMAKSLEKPTDADARSTPPGRREMGKAAETKAKRPTHLDIAATSGPLAPNT